METVTPILFLLGMIIMAISELLNKLNAFIPNYPNELTKLMDEGNYCKFNMRFRRRIEAGEGKDLDTIFRESATS